MHQPLITAFAGRIHDQISGSELSIDKLLQGSEINMKCKSKLYFCSTVPLFYRPRRAGRPGFYGITTASGRGGQRTRSPMGTTPDYDISVHRVTLLLSAVASGLVVAHILSVTAWYQDWLPLDEWLYYSFFDLDEEESLGTWFSALILVIAGQLCWFQARRVAGVPGSHRPAWLLLALGFHLLSLDEIAGFHETVNTLVEGTHWTTFGALIGLGAGIAFLPFLWHLPARTRILFIVAGVIYLGGAVGVEFGTLSYEEADALDTLPYNLWNALEEGMEMAGIILFIYALLRHMAGPGQELALQVRLLN